MLKGQANTFYYNHLAEKGYKLRYHFKTEENKQQYILKWRETTFLRIIITNLNISQLNYL